MKTQRKKNGGRAELLLRLPPMPGKAAALPYRGAHGVARPACLALLLGFILLHSAFCLPASAQTYSIGWYKVGGGGGVSTNAQFTVSGTAGQHDSGNLNVTGDAFSLGGGFRGYAIPFPTLAIVQPEPRTNVVISWRYPSGGIVLQENTVDVSQASAWSNLASPIVVNNGRNTVTLPFDAFHGFYRLKSQ